MEFRAPVWALLAVISGWMAVPAAAQQRPSASQYSSQFLPAGRELKHRLTSVTEAVQEKRFAEAAATLGEIFLDEELEDYFVEGGRRSFKGDAQQLLLSLPRAGRESYELQYGADARKLLNIAIDDANDSQLVEVMQKYFYTKAGYEAAILWSRRQLDAGRPLAAAVVLERVLKVSPYSSEYDPELSLLTAISWRLAGQAENAKAALIDFKARHTASGVNVAGKRTPMFRTGDEALAWLDALLGEQAAAGREEVTDWRMHRGNAARNATSAGSPPVPTMRWHKVLGREEADNQLLARIVKDYQSQVVAALPTVSPLVVKNAVLMRTAERLMAVDLETGKFKWRYPWNEIAEAEGDAARSSRVPLAMEQHKRELTQRIFEDRAYGQVSSDGESVFLLDEMGFVALGSVPSMIVGPGGFRQRNPGQPNTHNTLVALQLTTGKLRWTVGGETGDAEPKLAGAFFLGVPLAHDGQLFVMSELNGELRLVVLDAATGKLAWSQQLVHIEQPGQQILGDSTRRLSGATPSLASGVVICPTSSSAVVAVDLIQRRLLWGYQYDASLAARSNNSWMGYVHPVRPVGTYWLDATVAIADGKVVLTPTDSDSLICLDLMTGKEAWKPIKRVDNLADMLYVACVSEGNIVLVGHNRVTAVSLATGKPVWDEALQLGSEATSGRGFASDHYYFLPTSQSQLLKIDVRTGTVAQRTPTGRVLGNLVAYGNQLVSQQYDGVTTFYQSEALRIELAERLKKNPKDPLALSQRAQLELYDGKRAEALATLRTAHELDRTNDDTRALLVRTLLDALERDFASFQPLATEVEPLLDQPQQRRDFLRLKAQGLEKTGDAQAAFAAYVTLAGHEILERPDSTSAPSMESFEPQLRVRFDRWVRARLLELYETGDAPRQKSMDALITAQLAKLPVRPTSDQYLRVVNYFGWNPLADNARVELAAQRLETGDLLVAEGLLTSFDPTDKRDVAGRAAALLAGIYQKAGRSEYAAEQLARLRDHFADVKVHGDETGKQVYDASVKNPVIAARMTNGDWPGGRVEVTEGGDLVDANVNFSRRVYPMPTADVRGVLNDGSALIYDSRQRLVTLRDRWGAEWNQISLSSPDSRPQTPVQAATTHAHLIGHLAVVSVGQELIAFDMLAHAQDASEAQLWRQNLLPSMAEASLSRRATSQTVMFSWAAKRDFASYQADCMVGSVASLGDRSLCFARGREVICVDPYTGETLWERGQLEAGSELFGDEELLFVIGPRREEATVLSAADGRELGKRKVGAIDFRWTTLGRNVMSCQQVEKDFKARLYDAWSEKTLWEGTFTFGTRGALIGRDEFAMMQPDGAFTIVSLVDGSVRCELKLEPETKLMNIHLLRSQSQYFVQMDTVISKEDSIAGSSIQPVPGGDTAKLVTGRLYAIDRATMKLAWQSPAYVSQNGLPLDQPTEVPILVYLRQIVPTERAPSREARTGVLVLDRRDGRLLLERDNIRIQQTNVYDVVANPDDNTVTLTLMTGRGTASGKTFNFKFTDKPTPPSPPARTGVNAGAASSGGGSMFQAIGRAIEAGIRPLTDEEGPDGPAFPAPRPPPLPPGFPPGLPPGLVPRPR